MRIPMQMRRNETTVRPCDLVCDPTRRSPPPRAVIVIPALLLPALLELVLAHPRVICHTAARAGHADYRVS